MPQTLHALGGQGPGDPSPGQLLPLEADRPTGDSSASTPIRVLIAEGQGLVRAGFHALLERQDDMRVVAQAASGEEAVDEAQRTHPDVVLMDIALPGLAALEAARRIREGRDGREVRVLMLTTADRDDAVFAALRAGATGLLAKDAEPGELVDSVRVVAGGEVLLAPAMARRVVADFLARPQRLDATPEQLEELTPRELEVVGLVACGLSNEEIAERLVVTRATAKTHVSRALYKLHARDRAQLVVLAYEAGLVRPGPRWSDAAHGRYTRAVPGPSIARAPIAAPARRADREPVAA
jgi:DNA-binding NarL/FixJ family response regulator